MAKTIAHDGRISYLTNSNSSQSVYELNITLYDALNNPNDPDASLDARRFLASQAIMFSLAGVPGIYFHSLFGLRNCQPCAGQTGMALSINREKFTRQALEAKLTDTTTHHDRVFDGYRQMLNVRRRHAAFHPRGRQRALLFNPSVFALLRTPPNGNTQQGALCLVNVSAQAQTVIFRPENTGLTIGSALRDLLGVAAGKLRTATLH